MQTTKTQGLTKRRHGEEYEAGSTYR